MSDDSENDLQYVTLSDIRKWGDDPMGYWRTQIKKEPSMSKQCECANMDWSDVDKTLPHHPSCKAGYVEGFISDSFVVSPGKLEKQSERGWQIPGRAISALDSDLGLRNLCEQIAGLVCPDLGDCSIAPTGEGYLQLSTGGFRSECQRCGLFGTDARHARSEFLRRFIDYAADHHGILYWREYPNLVSEPGKDKYCVWARFIISDKPIIEQS